VALPASGCSSSALADNATLEVLLVIVFQGRSPDSIRKGNNIFHPRFFTFFDNSAILSEKSMVLSPCSDSS
jgi:hypothetical protein